MNESFIECQWEMIDNILTYILQSPNAINQKNVIIIIPGNPGVADYYKDFMIELYKKLDYKYGIICISHAGHVTLPGHLRKIPISTNYSSLSTQIRHKITYIENKISNECKIILIGHSIGCYMIINMLELINPDRIIKSILLFPTIERMAESPRGKDFIFFCKYFYWVMYIFLNIIFIIVPKWLLRYLIGFVLGDIKSNECAIEATLKVASLNTVTNSLNMGLVEMEIVKEANYRVITNNINKLVFFYGIDDHWCPLNYSLEMKKKFPSAKIYIADQKHKHAFVLDSSKDVADICVEKFIL